MVNCTLAGNVARGGDGSEGTAPAKGGIGFGGGIACVGGNASLLNVTVASNVVQPGFLASVPLASGSSLAVTNATVKLRNTILASAPLMENVLGRFIDLGHNLFSDPSSQFILLSSFSNADPGLGHLKAGERETPVIALLPNSLAIDSGDNSGFPATDQRGVRRPQGLGCDIGAFELAPEIIVAPGPQGQFTFRYTFRAGTTNCVSASADLKNWMRVGTKVADSNGRFEFEDPEQPQRSMRVFRIQMEDLP
jgi:hypothetical protein